MCLQPVQGRFGRFFGESLSPGLPILVPSRDRRSSNGKISHTGTAVAAQISTSDDSAANSKAAEDAHDSITALGEDVSRDTLAQLRTGACENLYSDPGPGDPGGSATPDAATPAEQHSGDLRHQPWRGFEGCLGDMTDIALDVMSSLPEPLDVSSITVVLSVMQVAVMPKSHLIGHR